MIIEIKIDTKDFSPSTIRSELNTALLSLIDVNVIGLRELRDMVATYWGIDSKEMVSDRRKEHIVHARQLFCYIAHKYFLKSFAEIGISISRDHSTVIAALKKAEDNMVINKDYKERFERFEEFFK